MKKTTIRTLIPLAILLFAGICFVARTGFGSLSAIGWEDVSVLCPLGALGTMIASKTIVPRAVVSLLLGCLIFLIVGRVGCGWMCPVPVWNKIPELFKKKETEADKAKKKRELAELEKKAEADTSALTPEELKLLKKSCHAHQGDNSRPSSARYIVLGGAVVSTAIFGFPVFCMICPIGLSFAFVFALILLFGNGDLTLSVVVIPAILLIECVFFRKWCTHICPMSALMSLVAKLNRTFRPSIDDSKCLETSRGATCGRCAEVCEMKIDPRHPELGTSMSECSRCMRCIDACPGKAIKLPIVAKKPQPVRIEEPVQMD